MEEERKKIKRIIVIVLSVFCLSVVLVFLGVFVFGTVIELLGRKALSLFFESL